jgi:hypothetical protein
MERWVKDWGDPKVKTKHFPSNGVPKVQRLAMHDCVKRLAHKHTWVALIDADEFLVLKKHNHVVDLLSENLYNGSLSIHWYVFGTSNKTVYEPIPVTKRFQYRGPLHGNCKVIVKTEDFISMPNPHEAKLRKGTVQKDTNGLVFSGPSGSLQEPVPDNMAVLYHYKMKSLEEWRHKYCVRGQAVGGYIGCVEAKLEVGTIHDDSAWIALKQYVPKYNAFN